MPGKKNQQLRSKEVAKITEFFKKNYTDVPVIVCGDFNDDPTSQPILDMEKNFVDIYTHMMMQDRLIPNQRYPEFTLVYKHENERMEKLGGANDSKSGTG